MAMPAFELESETTVEERVARLEANVEHIQSDISEMKVDLRRLNDKFDGVDQKLTAKIDGVDQKVARKAESPNDFVANLTLTFERNFRELRRDQMIDRIWWLLMSGALLGIMARMFNWL